MYMFFIDFDVLVYVYLWLSFGLCVLLRFLNDVFCRLDVELVMMGVFRFLLCLMVVFRCLILLFWCCKVVCVVFRLF